jgi:peptidoglycan/xylan/chitin deacetylase (PgdA/CDA1 family)
VSIRSAITEWANATRGLPVPVMHRLDGGDGVALTIDDGPTPEATMEILAALRRHDARATFFVSGMRAEAHPDLLDRMAEGGHQIYNHGYAHLRLDHLDDAAVIADLDRAEAILARIRPAPSPYPVRLPFGEGWRVKSVHRALAEWRADARIVQWTRHAHDWDIAGRCASSSDIDREAGAAAAVLTNPRGLAGAILLAHDRPIDVDHPLAGEAAVSFIDQVLRNLAETGTRIVPLQIR